MRFIFLAHWTAERMATTERLALGLQRMGHSILHLVAPRRNLVAVLRYNRAPHPLPSTQLWSPVARPGPARPLDVRLALLQTGVSTEAPDTDQVVVLQSPWLAPLAERIFARRRIYAAIDEYPGVDSRPAVRWSDAVFCVSDLQETVLRASHPGKTIENLGQCGRFASDFRGPRDKTPTVVYVGLDHPYLVRDLLRQIAKLPARLLLVGCDTSAAETIFAGRVPANVEALGWLNGDAFAQAICRGWLGILPYNTADARVHQSHPDKVYDYLMAGLQVVATAVPALDRIPGVIVSRPEDFASAVLAALQNCGPSVARHQQEVGRRYSADVFATQFMARLIVPGVSDRLS